MSDPIETVFEPYALALTPPVGGVETVTITREADTYLVFATETGGGLTADRTGTVEESIRAAIALWSAPQDPPIPFSVKAWRLRTIAEIQGINGAVNAAIERLSDPIRIAARNAFIDADVEYDHPITVIVYQEAGLTPPQVADLFRAAANLA